MGYTRQEWYNVGLPTLTPLNQTRLNHMEAGGIEAAHIILDGVQHGLIIRGAVDTPWFNQFFWYGQYGFQRFSFAHHLWFDCKQWFAFTLDFWFNWLDRLWECARE